MAYGAQIFFLRFEKLTYRIVPYSSPGIPFAYANDFLPFNQGPIFDCILAK